MIHCVTFKQKGYSESPSHGFPLGQPTPARQNGDQSLGIAATVGNVEHEARHTLNPNRSRKGTLVRHNQNSNSFFNTI